jgi:FlaA1/EpsC-like NDP-sugar epimerase/lipopolysaccharide/colanic/teichoic acid biosynthesis glycosyltransferase
MPKQIPKRIMDVLFSLIGLIVLAPFLPLIGLLIKLDSKGPVFYFSDRVGKGMKIFKMFKFRTMIVMPIEIGERLSPQYDPRVTSFGRFLRRTKINELPQFWNILKGEMTFVGPRPEAPDIAQMYPEDAKRIFSIKPGLISPATLLGRNEEEAYPPGVDAKKYYIQSILPDKIKLDLKYFENPTLFQDFKLILMGAKETLIGGLNKKYILANDTWLYLILSDIFLISCSYLLMHVSALLVWNLDISSIHPIWNFFTFLFVRLTFNAYFHMYSCLIRYISFSDFFNVFKGVTSGTVFLVLAAYLTGGINTFGFILAIDWACLILFLSVFRLILRVYWDETHRRNDDRQRRRILIYGVCDEGNLACRALTTRKYLPFQVVGFIDDSPEKYGKIINGKKVLGSRHHIKALAKLYRVEEILVANPGIYSDRLEEVLAICREEGLTCRMFNFLEDFTSRDSHIPVAREIHPADVLPLKRITADYTEIKRILHNKAVLINGPNGALGLEVCRKILQLGCRNLIIIERYESYLNELMAVLLNHFSQDLLVPILIDAEREAKLEEVFRVYQPGLVIHSGMRKYEPFLAIDLGDLGQINYFRTFNLTKLAANFGCEIFIMISSLHSLQANQNAHPITNSLRIAELSLEYFFSDTQTRFIIARICDIAENRGGIVSTLATRIRNREAVVLPYPGVQASILSKDSAAEFILLSLTEAQKSSYTKKIFNCEPGPPISLMEVTRRISNLYGLNPGSDFEVQYAHKSVEDLLIPSPNDAPQWGTPPVAFDLRKEGPEIATDRVKSLFKDFVLLGSQKVTFQDWGGKTRELLKLCGPNGFVG